MITRKFFAFGKAYYDTPQMNDSGKILDRILIGVFDYKKQNPSEFSITWAGMLDEKPFPKLVVCDNAWSALYHNCQDLLEEMAAVDDQSISVEQMVAILLRLGFEDTTNYSE